MSHRMNNLKHLPDEAKRRLLISLTAVSVVLIVALWIIYFDWTLQSPLYGAPPAATAGDIFKTGLSVIGATVERGIINSYLYAHAVISQGRTFIIER